MASSDVRVAQNEHLKHPYLLALVRWLVSSFWSSATVLLHRLVAAPLPPVPAFPARWKPRPASSEHLHPEPLVQCEVLHTPAHHTLDVIFVHGLYGSLGNTWRQGEWKAKYKVDPVKVPLRRPHSVTSCTCSDDKDKCDERVTDTVEQNGDQDEEVVAEVGDNLYTEIKKIIPKDDIFITEKFYNNTLLNQVEIVGNYESQAQFVRDLFENDNNVKMNDKMKKCDENINCEVNCDKSNDCQCRRDDSDRIDVGCNNCSEISNEGEQCEVGCGCICDECYSSCWPRDWVPADHPGARVISINYTSDPHLWRPLWIKPSKRLQLHERAEQMMSQLLALGVGERPIIWVGHSKGGLFIKQMYCEGYEAYMKMKSSTMTPEEAENFKNEQTAKETDTDNMYNNNRDSSTGFIDDNVNSYCNGNTDEENEFIIDCINNEVTNNGRMDFYNNDNLYTSDSYNNNVNYLFFNNADEAVSLDNNSKCDREEHLEDVPVFDNSSNDQEELVKRSQFWTRSAGFMFYSVPHRGSPLADIKTPITARSIELMEIAKDCQLVLSLQSRWSQAVTNARPAVRSVVETCTTLMSVLWLRIVSVDSADPGIGSLYGVNVDHREICKPSSRRCLLYQELMTLMSAALRSYARSE